MRSYAISKLNQGLFLKNFELFYKKTGNVPPPKFVVWDCTRRCNFRCIHCGATKEKYSKELKTGEIEAVIDQLAGYGVKTFAVTGGEPFLRHDLIRVLKHAHEKGLDTGIATNGYFIDEKRAKEISGAGVDSVMVSLDGLKNTHNHIRGNSKSFDRAVNAIILLKKYRIPTVSVATTLTSKNITELDGLMELILNLNVDLWRINPLMPIGRAWDNKSLFPSKKQFVEFLFFVSNNKKRVNIAIGENMAFLGDWDKKVRLAPTMCPVGFTACCIGVDGHVRGCPEQPDTDYFREGSVLENSFKSIWENGFGKYRRRTILKEDKKCQVCEYKNDCLGGCWVMREKNMHCIKDYLH